MACLVKAGEPVGGEALVTEPRMEGLDEPVLLGFAWLGECKFDAFSLGPLNELHRTELRPVVEAKLSGLAVALHQLVHHEDDVARRVTGPRLQMQAEPRVDVENGQAAKRNDRAAFDEAVVNEVQSPRLAGPVRNVERRPLDNNLLSAPLSSERHVLFPVDSLDSLVVHAEPSCAKQAGEHWTPIFGMLLSQLPQCAPDLGVVARHSAIVEHRPRYVNQSARLPHAQAPSLDEIGCHVTLGLCR
ncbi:MAG: hypothetical protein BGO01_07730 [Armatimonadetes bacterium 55-13]|nr:MAG: hypothetical protein BGO01_07730 [Armatimonadetes bacterium 55-13]